MLFSCLNLTLFIWVICTSYLNYKSYICNASEGGVRYAYKGDCVEMFARYPILFYRRQQARILPNFIESRGTDRVKAIL